MFSSSKPPESHPWKVKEPNVMFSKDPLIVTDPPRKAYEDIDFIVLGKLNWLPLLFLLNDLQKQTGQ